MPKEMKLTVEDDGSVRGVVVGSPADTGGGGGSAPTGDPTQALPWVPEDDQPYQKRGHMVIGQLYVYEGMSMPGYGAAISMAVQPNVQCAIGASADLEAGAQMGTSPVVHTLEGGFRVFFMAVQGTPNPTECTLNVTPYNVP